MARRDRSERPRDVPPRGDPKASARCRSPRQEARDLAGGDGVGGTGVAHGARALRLLRSDPRVERWLRDLPRLDLRGARPLDPPKGSKRGAEVISEGSPIPALGDLPMGGAYFAGERAAKK